MMPEFIALTGNRRIEFMQLEIAAVDLDAGTIHTNRAKQHDGKTKREEIVIGQAMRELLQRILALPRPDGAIHLFLTRGDGNPYTDDAFNSLRSGSVQ